MRQCDDFASAGSSSTVPRPDRALTTSRVLVRALILSCFHDVASAKHFQVLAVVMAVCVPTLAAAQGPPSSDHVNESNNPLTQKVTCNLQNLYVMSYFDRPDINSNAFLLRGILPHKFLGPTQLFRATLPINTSTDNLTGLGDFNLIDLFLYRFNRVEFGTGPQFTVPSEVLGTGKWQAGVAEYAVVPEEWGLLAALVTWQHSFAGNESRSTTNVLEAQPIITYHFKRGIYVRTTATWNFDFEHDTYFIPLSLGLGKVWVLRSGATLNLFAEPQITAFYEGSVPHWQIWSGLNMQFPTGKH